MSRRNTPMDYYFQHYNLPRILISRNKGDLIPLIAEKFDHRLHLPENLSLIENEWRNYIDY